MKDYRKLVSRKPPEGLLGFALARGELDTAGLVYEIAWVQDGGIEAMFENPGRKMKAVRCTCSECGQSMIMPYAPPNHTWTPKKDMYGFYVDVCQGMEPVTNGDSTLCPICGSPVSVRCAARIGRGEFTADEARVMSASLLPGEPGERPLVLTGWEIRRLVNRCGYERYDIRPLEAYVFEKDSACKLSGWVKSYSGTAGYFMSVCREWRQPRDWSETWGQVQSVFGLTPELMADSCLSNSKFDIYMADDWSEFKSPVPYLRLYQRVPQIENLVVQDCSYLLDKLFDEHMPASVWENNRAGVMELPELHLEERRPAQILGLNKDEFSFMREQHWDLYHWQVYVKAKAVGDRMKLPEDIIALHEYGVEDIERVIGRAPVGKTLRYLLKAIREWGTANDPYNEYVDYMPEDDRLNAAFLVDYWNMAEAAGWDLSNPEVRWPNNLIAAHERAMTVEKVVRTKALARKFRERAKALARYTYVSGPLMISPATNQNSLTREGALLRHCVAGYGEDVALGKTSIFFIRHTWAPRKPYYTLEFDEQKERVRQNQGYRHAARTPEVEAFEKEWLAWVKKGCKRKKDGTPVGAKPPVKVDPSKKELAQSFRQDCA